MVLPTGLTTPGISKNKKKASAAAVGGPSGSGFVAPVVEDMAAANQQEPEELPQLGTAPSQQSSNQEMVAGMKEGVASVQDQGRNTGKLGANLPTGFAGVPTGNGGFDSSGVNNTQGEPQAAYQDPNAAITSADLDQDINQNDLDSAAFLRALGLLTGGNPVTDAELQNTRDIANRAGADEMRRLRAMFGGAGFGTSGLAGATLSDAAVSGALATEQAVADRAAAGRAEQLQNILAGAQVGQSQRTSMNAQERNQLIMQLLQAELEGQDDGSAATQLRREDFDSDDEFRAAQAFRDQTSGSPMHALGDAIDALGSMFNIGSGGANRRIAEDAQETTQDQVGAGTGFNFFERHHSFNGIWDLYYNRETQEYRKVRVS